MTETKDPTMSLAEKIFEDAEAYFTQNLEYAQPVNWRYTPESKEIFLQATAKILKDRNIIMAVQEKAEFMTEVIERLEDFLEANNIEIPNPEKEEALEYDDPESIAPIYGTDYAEIGEIIERNMQEQLKKEIAGYNPSNPCDVLDMLALHAQTKLATQSDMFDTDEKDYIKAIQEQVENKAPAALKRIMDNIAPKAVEPLKNDGVKEIIILAAGSKYPIEQRTWDFSKDTHPFTACQILEDIATSAKTIYDMTTDSSKDKSGLTDTINDLRSSLEQISSYEFMPNRDFPRKIIVSNSKWHDSYNDSNTKAIFDARIDGETGHMVYIGKDNELYYSHSFYDKASGGTVLERLPIPKETEVVLSESAKELLSPQKRKKTSSIVR